MAKELVEDYSFDPAARAVTIEGYGDDPSKYRVTSIRNATKNEVYYTASQVHQVSITGQVFTLPVGYFTIAPHSTDTLAIYFDPELPDPTEEPSEGGDVPTYPALAAGTGQQSIVTTDEDGLLHSQFLSAQMAYLMGQDGPGIMNYIGAVPVNRYPEVHSGSYTPDWPDYGKTLVEAGNNSDPTEITISADVVTPFPVGTWWEVITVGTADVLFLPATGAVNLRTRDGFLPASAGQWGRMVICKRATNEWIVTGDLADDA